MKEKILQALKLKYASKGLSEKTLNAIAERLAGSVTEESGIDAAVTAEESLVNAFQSEADTRVQNAVAKAKAEAKPADKKEEPAPATPPPTSEVSPEMKAIMDALKGLTDQVTQLKSEKSTDTRKAQIDTVLEKVNPKFKDAILDAFGMMTFPDEAAFSTYLEKVKVQSADFVQSEANDKLGGAYRPAAPSGGANGKTPAKEAVDSIVSKIM